MLLAALAYLLLALRVTVTLFAGGGASGVHAYAEVGACCMSVRFDWMVHPDGRIKRIGLQSGSGRRKRGAPSGVLRRFLRMALRQTGDADLFLDLRVGTGDAAQTAVLCGAVRASALALAGAAAPKAARHVRIVPVFDRTCFLAQAHCIFSFSVGDTLLAVLFAAVKTFGSEGFRWKGIRLKV